MPRFTSASEDAFAGIDELKITVGAEATEAMGEAAEAMGEAAEAAGAEGDVVINLSQMWRDGIVTTNQKRWPALSTDLSSVLPSWALYALLVVVVGALLFYAYRTLRHISDKSKVA